MFCLCETMLVPSRMFSPCLLLLRVQHTNSFPGHTTQEGTGERKKDKDLQCPRPFNCFNSIFLFVQYEIVLIN